jgi:AcrR family transcriptional regulator
VADHQRQRLLFGTAGALAEHGYAAMTVEHVLERAGVSRTTFYDNFQNKRDCVLAAHEAAFNSLSSDLLRACAGETDWPSKVKAGVAAAMEFTAHGPEEALLLVIDAVAAEPALATRVVASNEFLVGLLRGGRDQIPNSAILPEVTERALIGAATSVVGGRLMAGETDSLSELEPQIVQVILMPYLGVEEARRVAYGE